MEKRIIMPPTIILHWTAGSSALKKAQRSLKALPSFELFSFWEMLQLMICIALAMDTNSPVSASVGFRK